MSFAVSWLTPHTNVTAQQDDADHADATFTFFWRINMGQNEGKLIK